MPAAGKGARNQVRHDEPDCVLLYRQPALSSLTFPVDF